MKEVILYKAGAALAGERSLCIDRAVIKDGVFEIAVKSDKSVIELYICGELKFRQKGSREFIFCLPECDLPAGNVLIKAQSADEVPVSDEITVTI